MCFFFAVEVNRTGILRKIHRNYRLRAVFVI